MNDTHASLRRLARAWGVQNSYRDIEGVRHVANPEALVRILQVLGAPIGRAEDADEALRVWRLSHWNRPVDPVTVVWQGRPAFLTVRDAADGVPTLRGEITLEAGGLRTFDVALSTCRTSFLEVDGLRRRKVRVPLPGDLPMGYHRLRVTLGARTAESTLFVSPEAAFTPPGSERAWGAFLPLYALRTQADWGVGDLNDLGALAQWSAKRGARIVGTLPLLAAFLDETPFEPSPYAPVSRLFWNELFLDVEVLPELARSTEAQALVASEDFQRERAALRRSEWVDYRAIYIAKRKVLAALSQSFFRDPEPARLAAYEAFLAEQPEVEDYARFRAVVQARGESWWIWPEPLRSGELHPGDWDEEARRYHLFVQFAFHEQLDRATAGAREAGVELYLDLPIGVHSDGYDVWHEQSSFALGMSAGAPPDPFFTGGQSWGFPPLNPQTSRQTGHAYWIACLRNHLRYARRLRIDHVMGLHRLYWIPEGFGAKEGVYVRYPANELYAAMIIESHRAKAEIVGENLGTVPPYVDEAMRRHRVQGMYVGEFSITSRPEHAIHPPRPGVLAAMNTHDMPTFAGYWHGDDIQTRVDLGFIDEDAAGRERWIRGEQRHALSQWLGRAGFSSGEERPEVALEGSLAWLASTDTSMVMVNLEDLWLERAPQNVPGTHRELPNWKHRAHLGFEDFREHPEVLRILERVDGARRRGS